MIVITQYSEQGHLNVNMFRLADFSSAVSGKLPVFPGNAELPVYAEIPWAACSF